MKPKMTIVTRRKAAPSVTYIYKPMPTMTHMHAIHNIKIGAMDKPPNLSANRTAQTSSGHSFMASFSMTQKSAQLMKDTSARIQANV